MEREPPVSEYMTPDVATVAPSDSVSAVTERINDPDGPSGFPVCKNESSHDSSPVVTCWRPTTPRPSPRS